MVSTWKPGGICRGAMNRNECLVSWCRRGLLAYVYNGVSLTTQCLSGGKWLLYSTALWP